MANFSREIKNEYGTKTYQNTKNTYDWIMKALQQGNFSELEVDARFLFSISKITCSCEGIAEFVENAYGYSDYSLISVNLYVTSEKQKIVFIGIDGFNRIRVSTSSKMMLERIINLLHNTKLNQNEVDNPTSVTYIGMQINNEGVMIKGDGNIVASNNSKVDIEKEQGESYTESFWTGILQNIASNFIWYLLTLLAGGMLTYLVTN